MAKAWMSNAGAFSPWQELLLGLKGLGSTIEKGAATPNMTGLAYQCPKIHHKLVPAL
jgi:hypothetical protein